MSGAGGNRQATEADARAARLDRVRPALCCPACAGELEFTAEAAVCKACTADYPQRNGRLYFVDVPARDDALDSLKGALKHLFGKLYYSVGVTLFAPTFPFSYTRAIRRHVDPSTKLVVDIGCGNHRVDDDLITIDLFDYDAVDIVCDLTKLPFREGEVDAFTSRSVLEHVSDLPAIADSLGKATASGGVGVHLIPFLYPFHASPDDYTRLTHKGAARLFGDWELIEQRNVTGPATWFLVGFIEFLASLFSFGVEGLKAALSLLFSLLLFPIKFLDVFFVGRKSFMGMAPSILTVVRKP